MNVLASIVSHKICIEKGDSVHRAIDLTYKEKCQKTSRKWNTKIFGKWLLVEVISKHRQLTNRFAYFK